MITGIGIGWRPEIAGFVAELDELGFCEVIAESLPCGGGLPAPLAELRERGVPVIPHGVKLSLGSAEPVDGHRVTHLARAAQTLGAELVSEHIAFVRAGGVEAGHLLPVPRTRESLAAQTANILRTQCELPVPLALEPIAALFDWPDAEYDEADFLTELLDRTGALLLLDLANVYANALNRGTDPLALLDRLPLERIAYVHVAGGTVRDGLYHDTHTDPVPQPVLDLVRALCERRTPPGFLLERDGHYPPPAVLTAELAAIAAATHPVARSSLTRNPATGSRGAGSPAPASPATGGRPTGSPGLRDGARAGFDSRNAVPA
jgi:uncharacterized protein (UPF0276 family)